MEVRRDALLAAVATAGPERAARRPGPDAWSAVEIVEHLVLAERSVLAAVLDPAREPKPRRRTLRQRLVYHLVVGILRSPLRVSVPAREMHPSGGHDLAELRTMWVENHRRLRAFIAGLDAGGLREAVFRHPVSGPLTPAQAMRMLDVHLRRHEGQLRATLID